MPPNFTKKGAFAVSLLLVPLLVYLVFGHHLTLQSLKANRDLLTRFAHENFHIASVVFILVMITDIALTIPGATTLSFAGGLLFPQPYASLYAYIGYVVGACMSYFLVRTVLADYVRPMLRPNSAMFKKLEAKLRENAFLYVILARYTLIFPYWFVTATASIVQVPFSIFAPATSIAVIPGAIIYTYGGVALGAILDTIGQEGADVELSTGQLILKALTSSNDIKYLGAALAVAGLVPIILKRLVKKSSKN